MGIIADIQNDIKAITGNQNEFGGPMEFITPDGGITATINGLHTRHNLAIEQRENSFAQQFGSIGTTGNTIKAHVSFSEPLLTDEGYPVRTDGKINMKNHRVNVADNMGQMQNYIVMSFYPDSTIGLIVLLLGEYNGAD